MSEYNIQLASNLTGLSCHTLRAWEKRYQAVIPNRSSSGRRLYSEDDIKKLRALNDLCSLGHNIGSIAGKEYTELTNLLEKFGASPAQSDLIVKSDPEKAKKSLTHLLIALEGNRLDIISHELYNLKLTLSPRELALDVISPLMGQVGQNVYDGKFSIAQEHALSSIVKFHLGKYIYRSYEEKKRSKELIVITTPENEYHEFGILLASMLCIHYDHNFFYLGPNMPADALAEAATSIGATSIILGTSYNTCSPESPFLNDYISKALSKMPKDVKLIVGGPGYFDTTKFKRKENFNFLPTLNHLDQYLKNSSGS